MTATCFDFAVVGGGPAGLAASALLGDAGARVLLLDAGSQHNKKAGEFVHPSVKAFINRLTILPADWESAHLPVHGFVNGWASSAPLESDFLYSPHGSALSLNRCAFERQLWAAACRRGVDARTGAVVAGVERTRSNRWKIMFATQDAEESADASKLVLATGRAAKLLVRNMERVRYDRLAFLAVRVSARLDDSRPFIECFECGWVYVTPIPDECCLIYLFFDPMHGTPCRRSLGSLKLAVASCDRLSAFLESLNGQEDVSIEWFSGAAHSALAHRSVGDDWYLLGDLAEARDPLATSGIYHALRDGSGLCSQLLSGDLSAKAAVEMDEERKQSFLQYLESRGEFYRQEQRWSGSSFWAGEGGSLGLAPPAGKVSRLRSHQAT